MDFTWCNNVIVNLPLTCYFYYFSPDFIFLTLFWFPFAFAIIFISLKHLTTRYHSLCSNDCYYCSSSSIITPSNFVWECGYAAYLNQNHVYSSLSFGTEAVPPLVSFIHFPLNIRSRFAEQKVKIQQKHCWGELKLSAKLHIWPQKQSSPRLQLYSLPPSLLPSLPFLFLCRLSTSLLTLPDSCLCSLCFLSLFFNEAVNVSLSLWSCKSASWSRTLFEWHRWQ